MKLNTSYKINIKMKKKVSQLHALFGDTMHVVTGLF